MINYFQEMLIKMSSGVTKKEKKLNLHVSVQYTSSFRSILSPKIQILSSLTHPCVILKLYEFWLTLYFSVLVTCFM